MNNLLCSPLFNKLQLPQKQSCIYIYKSYSKTCARIEQKNALNKYNKSNTLITISNNPRLFFLETKKRTNY